MFGLTNFTEGGEHLLKKIKPTTFKTEILNVNDYLIPVFILKKHFRSDYYTYTVIPFFNSDFTS